MTDRDLALWQDLYHTDHLGTIWVDDGVEAVLTGRILTPRENYGNLLKRGAGAFVLATAAAGSVNRIGRVSALSKDGKLTQTDGNYPSDGFMPFTIADGRFVIDTDDSVTNCLNQVRIGCYTTDEAGKETAGHLEIRGGVNFIYGTDLHLGQRNGTTTTAPTPLASSLDVAGGETVVTSVVRMVHGWSEIANSTARPEINVSGGSLKLLDALYLNNSTSRGRISVSGGRMTMKQAVVGVNYSGATLDIALSGAGELAVSDDLQYGRYTDAYGTITIVGDSVLKVPQITSTSAAKAHEDIAMDGGTLVLTAADSCNLFGNSLSLGSHASTIDVSSCAQEGPDCRLTITGGKSGGALVIRNAGPFKRAFRFYGLVSCAGGVEADGIVALRICGGSHPTGFTVPAAASFGARMSFDSSAQVTATVKSLAYPDATGTLEVGFSKDATKCWKTVVTDSFVPPTEALNVGFYAYTTANTSSSPLGTWDLLDFPASVSFDPAKCCVANPESGRSYAFSVAESAGVKTLRVTIGTAATLAEAEKMDVSSDVTISTARDFWNNANKTIAGDGALTIADGACVRFNQGVTFAVKTLNLNGGRIVTSSPFADGVTGSVNWNGTVICPTTSVDENELLKGYSDKNAARVTVGANGGVIDTSMMRCNWLRMFQRMSGTGTITVRGASTERTIHLRGINYGVNDFAKTIAFRAERGGCISLYGDNFSQHTLTVADGGAIGCNDRGDIGVLKLGETESDVTGVYANFKPTQSPAASERVRVLGTLTVHGSVRVAFRSDATSGDYVKYGLCCPPNGRWIVLEAPLGSIDTSKFALDPVICAGKKGVFDVVQGSADVLYVTISDADETLRTTAYPTATCAATHTWIGASGDFGEDANWDVAPEMEGEAENLAFAPTADIIVTNNLAVPVASLVNSAAHDVTLSGGKLVFADDATFDVSDSSGTLTLAGEVYGKGTLKMTRTSAGGKLTVAAPVRDAMTIRKDSGYLEGRPSDFGKAELCPNNATVKFLGSGVFAGKINHGNIDSTGLAISVDEGESVLMTGQYTSYSLLSKMGGGTFHLRCPASANLGNSNKTPGTPLFPANGDAPNGQTLTVFAGRLVLDCDTALSGETRIGPTPIVRNGGSSAYDAELVILSGTSSLKTFGLGRTFNSSFLNYTTLDARPRRTVTVAGGTLECTEFIVGHSASGANNDAGYNEVNVDGGTLRVTDGSKPFAIGYDGDKVSVVTKDGQGNESVLNLNSGLVERSAGGTIGIGWAVCKDSGFRPCRGTINVNGGILRTSSAGKVDLAHNADGMNNPLRGHVIGTLNLNGGRVEAGRLTRTCTNRCVTTVNLNGGTLALLGDAASVDAIPSVNVCGGGAMFEVAGAATVSSPLVHAEALGEEPDGGLVKTGAGTLTLDAANTFTGPLEVREGTVAFGASASPVAAVRVDWTGSSGAIAGLRTIGDATLYVDNYPKDRMTGVVTLPLAVTGQSSFARVVVNGNLNSTRRAVIKDGRIVVMGSGVVMVVR